TSDHSLPAQPIAGSCVEMHFQHLGIAVADVQEALPFYLDVFGYQVYSGPFDDPIQKVRVCFLRRSAAGEPELELVAPTSTDSPVRQILKKGGGGYHLCFDVADLREAIANLVETGCVVVSQPAPAVAFDHRCIAWLFTPTGQLIELVERGFGTVSDPPIRAKEMVNE